jgi:uncharacterized protein (DUF2336 family)
VDERRTSNPEDGLTPDQDLEALAQMAAGGGRADRARLLLAFANVVAAGDLRPGTREMAETLLPALALEADEPTRAELAARVAEAPWAPPGLLADLAREPLEVSRPLLARCARLDEASLLLAAREGGPEMHLILARRPELPAAVADALIRRGWPDALTALAGNEATPLSAQQMELLVAAARRNAALRAPLLRRVETTPEMAARLRAWGSVEAEDPEAQQHYVQKLQQCGRLTPGFALRVLREGRLGLFEQALATLAGATPDTVRQALDADTPEALMQACAAGGVDRSVMPAIAARVRELNGGRPGPGAATPA